MAEISRGMCSKLDDRQYGCQPRSYIYSRAPCSKAERVQRGFGNRACIAMLGVNCQGLENRKTVAALFLVYLTGSDCGTALTCRSLQNHRSDKAMRGRGSILSLMGSYRTVSNKSVLISPHELLVWWILECFICYSFSSKITIYFECVKRLSQARPYS